MTQYNKLFIPMRIQPPHKGHIMMLEQMCEMADKVTVGIGCANKHDKKNPYTGTERQLMLVKSLDDLVIENYDSVPFPDFEDNYQWLGYLKEHAGLDQNTTFVTGNPYVHGILDSYSIKYVDPELDLPRVQLPSGELSATAIRDMIAADDPTWKEFAATGTVFYFEAFGGRERISRFY